MTEKRKTHTSTAVKARYNAKAYDRIALTVKKGQKEIIKSRADELGVSVNEYINSLVRRDLSSHRQRQEKPTEEENRNA